MHVSDGLSVYHQEYIQHQVHVIQVLRLLASGIEMELHGTCSISVPASKQSQNLYDMYLMPYVQSQIPDDGRKDRLKHVECCPKIK